MEFILEQYLNQIDQKLKSQLATEQSYRGILEQLFTNIAIHLEKTDCTVINEAKRMAFGIPDLFIKYQDIDLGFVEAKDLYFQLDQIENSIQLVKYRNALENLILTNHLEFRYYQRGVLKQTVSFGKAIEIKDLNSRSKKDKKNYSIEYKTLSDDLINAFKMMVSQFFDYADFDFPYISTAKDLAKKLAEKALLISEICQQCLNKEILNPKKQKEHSNQAGFDDLFAVDSSTNQTQSILDLYRTFQEVLVCELTSLDFSDMYAQTICYGLFAIRFEVFRKNPNATTFNLQTVEAFLPNNNPFLKRFFHHILNNEIDQHIDYVIKQLIRLFESKHIASIFNDFIVKKDQMDIDIYEHDPVIHFYEDFLTKFDFELKEARGVYYTPDPVVQYMVQSIDEILINKFNYIDGLFTLSSNFKDFQILDPAVGTGSFLHGLIKFIYKKYFNINRGMWKDFARNTLVKRLFGFELMMTPFIIAHLKINLLLDSLENAEFSPQDYQQRLGIFLTNTLEQPEALQSSIPFAHWISAEANGANQIKNSEPIMIIIGNPPYSGHSQNSGEWIRQLLRGEDLNNAKEPNVANYFASDGKELNEKNSKWLNDDYVKFIRFAHWKIKKTGHGVIAYITNHAFLDNPTFRGMRNALLLDFDEIYILDLHGNAKKKEKSPDGSKDENVFNIQQGVAISFFIKHKVGTKVPLTSANSDSVGGTSVPISKIYHFDLFGDRKSKYEYLLQNNIHKTQWNELKPIAPFYLFVPQDVTHLNEYNNFYKITDIIPVNSVGIVTGKDSLFIASSKSVLTTKITEKYFNNPEIHLGENKNSNLEINLKAIKPCLYRAFDIRYCYYDTEKIERSRFKVMQHMIYGENLGLITVRQVAEGIFNHAYVSEHITDFRTMLSNKGGGYLFPLYLFEAEYDSNNFTRSVNLSKEFIQDFSQSIGLAFTPEDFGDLNQTFGAKDIFYYIYAVLNHLGYREKYAGFLKMDFPRIPLPHQLNQALIQSNESNLSLFIKYRMIGEKLSNLHLLKLNRSEFDFSIQYPESGSNLIEKFKHENECIYINKTQYFSGVTSEMWHFKIGGYQVLDKWLKDRKEQILTQEEVMTYLKILNIVKQTIDIQQNM